MGSETRTFSFINEIPQEISDLLDFEYEKYESSHEVQCDYRRFSIIARDDENISGILTGYTAFSEIYIDDLLVLPHYRRQGIGRKLLNELEEYFKNKNFTNINLVTNEFQAPEFYKKCGYCLEFVRKNPKFPKFTKYFFIKWLV